MLKIFLQNMNLGRICEVADNEYDKDQKYILETLRKLEGNVEKLFENDKKLEMSLSNLTGKLAGYGVIAMIAINYILGKF